MKAFVYSAQRPRHYGFLIYLITLIFLLALSSSYAQTIRYVKPSSSGSGDGSSWTNATSDLQSAINSLSATGGQVWVASGTYKPTANISDRSYPDSRNLSFVMKSKVAVYGGFSGNENSLSDRVVSYPSSTTLSGNIGDESTNADNSYHVVYAFSVDSTALLDGFVISDGNANGITYVFYNNGQGGGLLCVKSDIRLNNCSFINSYAGGAFTINSFPYGGNSSAIFNNCLFQNNSGRAVQVLTSDYGPATRLILSNCSFQSNIGGALYISTGGNQIYANLTNCSFQDNLASQGGAIFLNLPGAQASTIQLHLVNSVVFGNGGANSFFSGRIGNLSYPPYTTIYYNNSTSSISARYSLIEQAATNYIADNTDQTILFSPFASTTSTQLAPCSPAINAGDPNTTTYQVGVTDLIGNPRFIGNLDMGAYEFQTTPCPPEFQEFISTQTGRWDDPATWSTGRLPSSSDVVHLKHTVTIPQSYVANARKLRIEPVARLLYETGGRLQLSP